jgi:hypothetical protein
VMMMFSAEGVIIKQSSMAMVMTPGRLGEKTWTSSVLEARIQMFTR